MSLKLLSILAMLARIVAAQNGNFTDTCTDIELLPDSLGHNDNLRASCRTDTLEGSQSRTSTIDLNLCVGIDHTSGELAWSV